MKTCFLIGHRDAPERLLEPLAAEVERHITALGVTEFVVGQKGAFDRLAARAVRRAKQGHPEVVLTLLLPYYLPGGDIPAGFDTTFYPPGLETVPKRFAIPRSNRAMVDRSDYLIAYAWQTGSNTEKLTAYARRRQTQGQIQVTVLPHGGE